MKPEILSIKSKFKQDWIEVVEDTIRLDNGKVVKWSSIKADHDAVSGIVLDKENNIYLVKEWRPAWDKEIIGIPTGAVDVNSTEDGRLQQLHNELREELGCDARKIEKLTTTLTSNRIRMKKHLYLATDLFESKKERDEEELIEIVKMPFSEAYKMFVENKEETTEFTFLGIVLVKEKLGL